MLQFVFVQSGFLHLVHVLHPGLVQAGLLQSSHLAIGSLSVVVVLLYLFRCRCAIALVKCFCFFSPQTTHVSLSMFLQALHCHVESVSADVGQYSWGIVIRSFTHGMLLQLGSPHDVQVVHNGLEQGGLLHLSQRIFDDSFSLSLNVVVSL